MPVVDLIQNGRRTTGLEAADWIVRIYAAGWLDAAGLPNAAEVLRNTPALRSEGDVLGVRDPVIRARALVDEQLRLIECRYAPCAYDAACDAACRLLNTLEAATSGREIFGEVETSELERDAVDIVHDALVAAWGAGLLCMLRRPLGAGSRPLSHTTRRRQLAL